MFLIRCAVGAALLAGHVFGQGDFKSMDDPSNQRGLEYARDAAQRAKTTVKDAPTKQYRTKATKVCPDKHIAVPKEDIYRGNITAHGCIGVEGERIDPKPDFGVALCCNTRQVCSQVCGTTPMMCENEFQQCLVRMCALPKLNKDKEACRNMVKIYKSKKPQKWVVTEEEHDEFQKKSCDCVASKEEAKARHKSLLEEIYNSNHTARSMAGMISYDVGKRIASMLVRFEHREHSLHYQNVKNYHEGVVNFTNDTLPQTWVARYDL